MQLYQEFPFLKIEVDETNSTIIMTWDGPFTSPEYREATKTCLAAVKEFKLKNWLADAVKIAEISPIDHEWTNENILVPASDLGIRKVAIIMPESVYNHLAISSILVKGKSRFRFESQYFINKKDALAWCARN